MEFDLFEITAPFRMQPGLSKMAPDARHTRLLEPDSTLFHEKLSVLCTHLDQALLQVAQFDTRPALHVLAQQLAVEWPQACTFADDNPQPAHPGAAAESAVAGCAGHRPVRGE